MSMTVVVARNAPDRFRGFLASVMLEVSPGTYVSPRMTRGVRERVWRVVCEWAPLLPPDASITLLWADRKAPSGLGIACCGVPKTELVDHGGLWLDRHELTAAQEKVLSGPMDRPLSDN